MSHIGDTLKLLEKWEERSDHDVGPGLFLSQAWIRFFADGSGHVVVELHTCSDLEESVNGASIGRLLTSLGVEGRMQKQLAFETPDELVDLLCQPLLIDYER